MDILRKLQSRIDKRGHIIFLWECGYTHSIPWEYKRYPAKQLVEEQTLDKRLYGMILRANRSSKAHKELRSRYLQIAQENVQLRNGIQLKF